MAIESRRSTPTLPVAAAVVSEASVAPRKVPCCQEKDSKQRGATAARRAPKSMALIGTPSGLCHSGAIEGHWDAGAVKRLFGCAAFSPEAAFQGCPCQSVRPV